MDEIRINKVVIHELVKEQHQKIKPSNMRKVVLSPSSEPVRKLVIGVASLYGKRNNSAHYGTFLKDGSRGIFPDAFEKFALLERPDDTQFLNLTESAMEALYKKAKDIHAASGGYMLYADYHNTQSRYFLVAMIKQKEGMTLSEHLEPEELTQLDLSRLYQAAKINFGKLSAFFAADEQVRNEINYLSFVSPSASKSAAGYFVTALGCAPGTASARATTTLIRESVDFFRKNERLRPHTQTFKNALLDYLTEKEKTEQSVKLSEIESLARRFFPSEQDEQADHIADEFVTFLNSEEHGVPVEFPVHKQSLFRCKRIQYKSDNWEFSFERNALGDKQGAKVHFDKENNRLILNDLPQAAVKLLEAELDSQKLG